MGLRKPAWGGCWTIPTEWCCSAGFFKRITNNFCQVLVNLSPVCMRDVAWGERTEIIIGKLLLNMRAVHQTRMFCWEHRPKCVGFHPEKVCTSLKSEIKLVLQLIYNLLPHPRTAHSPGASVFGIFLTSLMHLDCN